MDEILLESSRRHWVKRNMQEDTGITAGTEKKGVGDARMEKGDAQVVR